MGLSYADHAKELEFKPLAFLKGEASLTGPRAFTVRPNGVKFMHCECELAVVIGREAKHVKTATALDCVGGDTVANGYAIRDHLENWYRSNLRVKNRDTVRKRWRSRPQSTASSASTVTPRTWFSMWPR